MTNCALDDLCINTIRTLAVDAVQHAGSGHPGTPMGAAPMAYTLWTRFLRHNPANPDWPDRDRFVLSPGHASILLYSLLHLTGYDLSLDDIKALRRLGSRTPGHPERDHTPGVELTTGPLGAGFAAGVGLAIAERSLAAHFNSEEHTVVDHYTYGIVSDGDIMEGVAAEAASLAGTLGLGKLIYLYDDNAISIEGNTDLAFAEQVDARFCAYGWNVEHVADSNDVDAIAGAIERARAETERPSLIVVPTTIGFGSPNLAGTAKVHGAALGEEEVRLTKEALGWPASPPFHIPEEALAEFRKALDRGRQWEDEWHARVSACRQTYPAQVQTFETVLRGERPAGWDSAIPSFAAGDGPMATRVASGKVLNGLIQGLPTLVGGSADLAPSINTYLAGHGGFGLDEWCSHNMHFGVREHAMGNIANGMALHGGVIPYAATFFVFSDYMRPALRLAAIQRAPVVFIFTHDSIGVGEDGPTHQPIEHLASLRAMPGMTVYRPADANETAACWRLAIERAKPCALVLTRQGLPVLDAARTAAGVPRGAYVFADPADGRPDVILIATGSEVSLALEARELLAARGLAARVVSMPSWELFAEQTADYRDDVLPPGIAARVAIEAGSQQGWRDYAGNEGDIVGLDHFGASGAGPELFRKFGFTPEAIADRAQAVLERVQSRA